MTAARSSAESSGRIEDDTSGAGWTTTRRAALVGLVMLVVLIAFESIGVATAMPTVARALDGLAVYPIAFAVPYAASVLAMVGAGNWADARGPREVLLVGLAMFVGGLVLAGSAASMPVLVLGRTVQSLGGGLMSVAVYALVAAVFEPALRPKVFVGTSAAWVAPSLFGPPIAGWLADAGAWRWVFFGAALLALPAAALLIPVLRKAGGPTDDPAGRSSRRTVRQRLFAGLIAALGAALLSAAAGRSMPVMVVLVVLGLLLLALSVPRILPRGTARAAPGIPAIVLTRGLLMAGFAGTDIYLPLLLTVQHGMSPTVAGLVLTVGATSWFLGAWIAGRLTTDHARRRVVRIGLALVALGVAGCVIAVSPAVPGWLVYPAWLLGGGGIGVAYSSLTMLLMGMSAPSEQGRNASSLQVGETLTTSVVLGVSAVVFAAVRPISQSGAFTSGLVLAGLSALLGWWVSGRLAPVESTRPGRQ